MKNNNYEVTLKNYTRWDDELGSYILTEEGKKLSERDMINIIGNLEHRYDKDFVTVDDILCPEEDKTPVPSICGWNSIKENQASSKHTCGRCKYEYVSPDCYPCNECVYGTDHREDDVFKTTDANNSFSLKRYRFFELDDLWEEKEDD